jgi:hypothetical protein
VIESNQIHESFAEPVLFDNQQNLIKMRIIPPESTNILTEKISFQFWFKCVNAITTMKNLMTLIFNRNPNTFYSLRLDSIDNQQYQNKQFEETRKSDHSFSKWSRFNLDLEMVHLSQKQFKLKLNSFIDDVSGFTFERIFEELGFWKLNVIEFILGHTDFSQKHLDL